MYYLLNRRVIRCGFISILIGYFSVCVRAGMIEDEVGAMLDRALEKGEIFRKIDDRVRYGFVEYRFQLPESIRKDKDLFQSYMKCLWATVEKEGLVGPEQRPLVFLPLPDQAQSEEVSDQQKIKARRLDRKKQKSDQKDQSSPYGRRSNHDSSRRDDYAY